MNNITFLIQCSIVLMIISVIVIAAKEDTDDAFAESPKFLNVLEHF